MYLPWANAHLTETWGNNGREKRKKAELMIRTELFPGASEELLSQDFSREGAKIRAGETQ